MKFKQPLTLIHDTIPYHWEEVSDQKYHNWVKMSNREYNTSDFTAWGLPVIVKLEPSNLCNLACPLCPAGTHQLNRERRNLKLEEFKSLVDDAQSYAMLLVLWGEGEAFMNPEFPAMLRYATEKDIKTVTSTNAHFLQDEAYLEAILTSGLSTLIVAIDSMCEANYQVYRKGGDLNRAIEGLAKLLELKKRLGSPTRINWRMIIMRQNEHELKAMRKTAKVLGVDWFTVKTVNPNSGLIRKDDEFVPLNPKYRRYRYKEGTWERLRADRVCDAVWATPTIYSNGDVVPCCFCYDSKNKVGNIMQEPLSSIWNGPVYRELRKKVYHQKDSIDLCRECTMNFQFSESGWFIESIDFNLDAKTRLINKVKRSSFMQTPAMQKVKRVIKSRLT